MAVYTKTSLSALSDILTDFELGDPIKIEGIDGGIENTNYFVTLNNKGVTSEYVLTIFEELTAKELPFFVQLGQTLHANHVAVPYGINNKHGIAQLSIENKPAMLQPKFSGGHVQKDKITPAHCQAIAKGLAEFHLAGQTFPHERQAHRGVYWWREYAPQVAPHLTEADANMMMSEVIAFDTLRDANLDLPTGIMHGDLFHDNALFNDTNLCAILDIYNAATGYLLYDLAIVANDWSTNTKGEVDAELERALLTAYNKVRPFTPDERQAWPTLVRTAAMRFWLSRLIPSLGIGQAVRSGGEIKLLDPNAIKSILRYRLDHPSTTILDI